MLNIFVSFWEIPLDTLLAQQKKVSQKSVTKRVPKSERKWMIVIESGWKYPRFYVHLWYRFCIKHWDNMSMHLYRSKHRPTFKRFHCSALERISSSVPLTSTHHRVAECQIIYTEKTLNRLLPPLKLPNFSRFIRGIRDILQLWLIISCTSWKQDSTIWYIGPNNFKKQRTRTVFCWEVLSHVKV